MEKPLVSVIMGIYNCADTLHNAIESLISQTYTNWELIMCDDASTDNTYKVAKEFEKKYDNIHIIKNEKNMQLAYSLNQCLAIAKGEFIARMDSDDLSLPTRFEKQVNFLIDNPEYAVVGTGAEINSSKQKNGIRIANEKPTVQKMLHGTPYLHPTIMMRKTTFDVLNGYYVSDRTKRGQDLDLWFRFYAKGFKGYNLQEPLLIYHAAQNDYKKKRNLSFAWGITRTMLFGFRLNKFPIYKYPMAFKPIVSALIPTRVMLAYHNKQEKQ